MNVDKAELTETFVDKNYNVFFGEAKKISDFLLRRKFSYLSEEDIEDLNQDCMMSLWEKIQKGKVNPNKGDLFSFVWANSNFKTLEFLRKRSRRKRIAPMLQLDTEISGKNDWMMKLPGMANNPEEQALINEYREAHKNDKNNKKGRRKRV